jgi:hypothetical protein
VFSILMAWFDGEFVICLGLRGELVHYLIYCIFCSSLTFSSYSPRSLCFTFYTSLYLLNYAYHCVRMSSNEI